MPKNSLIGFDEALIFIDWDHMCIVLTTARGVFDFSRSAGAFTIQPMGA
jgi:hypothetical protein